MEYIHARIFSVYGPEIILVSGGKLFKGIWKRRIHFPWGMHQMWNFLYLEDCVRALILLMEQEKESVSGIYNVAAPKRKQSPCGNTYGRCMKPWDIMAATALEEDVPMQRDLQI